jgi:ubiquinone/menaquinone biosynthesis C-methylase UbiE
MKDNFFRMQTQLNILSDLGHPINSTSVVLDLGCGNGELVNEYIKKGYDAYGCDFSFKPGEYVDSLFDRGKIRKVDSDHYQLPFEDKSFDFVFTDQVFEHVKDYAVTLSEIKRVLKPGGVSLNFFPSRYQIIEPHVYVPFASINKNYYWLLFWAYVGIRKRSQKGLTARETAGINYQYLNSSTYYLTKSEITHYCKCYFQKVIFAEGIFMKHLRRYKFVSLLSNTWLFPWLYSTFRHRVLVLN